MSSTPNPLWTSVNVGTLLGINLGVTLKSGALQVASITIIATDPAVRAEAIRRLGLAPEAEYQRGYDSGKTAGYNDGFAKGKTEGTAAGYASGRTDGYADGRAAGYTDGTGAGFSDGMAKGKAQGHAAGLEEGRTEGYNAGMVQGHHDGYTDGVSEGKSTGFNAAVDDAIKQVQQYRTNMSLIRGAEGADQPLADLILRLRKLKGQTK